MSEFSFLSFMYLRIEYKESGNSEMFRDTEKSVVVFCS